MNPAKAPSGPTHGKGLKPELRTMEQVSQCSENSQASAVSCQLRATSCQDATLCSVSGHRCFAHVCLQLFNAHLSMLTPRCTPASPLLPLHLPLHLPFRSPLFHPVAFTPCSPLHSPPVHPCIHLCSFWHQPKLELVRSTSAYALHLSSSPPSCIVYRACCSQLETGNTNDGKCTRYRLLCNNNKPQQ